jgi:plastocyanin
MVVGIAGKRTYSRMKFTQMPAGAPLVVLISAVLALWGSAPLPAAGAGRAVSARVRAVGMPVTGHIVLPNGAAAAAGAAIWLEAPGLHGAPLKRAVIDQRNKRFIPHILIVTPGTKIDFPNNDTVFHNVFAYFEAKRFDLGMYPRGATKSQIFPRAGVVSVLCNIHPDMSAFIVIVDSPYYAQADKSGNFRLEGIPPGEYTVRFWHESGVTGTQKCTVSSDARPLSLKLERR